VPSDITDIITTGILIILIIITTTITIIIHHDIFCCGGMEETLDQLKRPLLYCSFAEPQANDRNCKVSNNWHSTRDLYYLARDGARGSGCEIKIQMSIHISIRHS